MMTGGLGGTPHHGGFAMSLPSRSTPEGPVARLEESLGQASHLMSNARDIVAAIEEKLFGPQPQRSGPEIPNDPHGGVSRQAAGLADDMQSLMGRLENIHKAL